MSDVKVICYDIGMLIIFTFLTRGDGGRGIFIGLWGAGSIALSL